MSKKGGKLHVKRSVKEVGTVLMGMVTAPGSKKEIGIPRAEVAALSFGLSMGLGIGALMQADEGFEEMMAGGDPVEAAAHILVHALEDWPEHRDDVLSKGWGDVKGAAFVEVRRDG